MNIYISGPLKARMDAAEAAAKENGFEKLNWSEVAQRAFDRECGRRERAVRGLPSANDVDIEGIALRAQRALEESYQVAFQAALVTADGMDDGDIYFLGDYDDSVQAFEITHGRIDWGIYEGSLPMECRDWMEELQIKRDALIRPMVDAARAHAHAEGLRFPEERAVAGAMAAFSDVCTELQRFEMRRSRQEASES